MLTWEIVCEPAKSKSNQEKQMCCRMHWNVSPITDTIEISKPKLDQQAEKHKA